MDVIVIEQVQKIVGSEEEGQRHHKMYDAIEQQDTIKTTHSTLSTVCLDVAMDQKHQKKHEMMKTQTIVMDVTMTEQQWKIVGCAEVGQ